jgi:hypothetical protein
MARGDKIVYLDIMLGGRFWAQLEYEYCPLFPIDTNDIRKFVISKFPSLRNKDFKIKFSNNKIHNKR